MNLTFHKNGEKVNHVHIRFTEILLTTHYKIQWIQNATSNMVPELFEHLVVLKVHHLASFLKYFKLNLLPLLTCKNTFD